MTTSISLPIVVGIDGSKSALRAAFWAADEAADRNVPLRLVQVVEVDDHVGNTTAHAVRTLQEASDALNASGRQVTIETDILQGDPVDVLAEASRSADMVCVGWKGTHDSGPGRRGSTAARLAQTVQAPLAIVHRRHAHERVGPHRWIVAVLNDTPEPHVVLERAMQEAKLRDASILALTPWPAGSPRSENVGAKLESLVGDRDIQIAVLPRSDDITNLLAQSAGIDQLVIASADDSESIAQLVSPVATAILRGTNCSLLVLPDAG